MDNTMDNSKTAASSSAMHIVRIATISSVQILVLVIAGTTGFIISILGLIIPNSLKSKPSTASTTLRRARSPSPTASKATSTSPSFHSSTSLKIAKNDYDAKNGGQDASSTQSPQRTLHAHPMSRGNSDSSKTSTLPDLGNSSSTTSSCSSSISDHHKQHHAHHHHGMNATALYEGIVNRCQGKKATSSSKKEDTTATASEEKAKADKSCRSRRTSLSSPRNSSEGVRARLSSLIMPHSHHSASHAKESSSNASSNNKRLSYHASTSGSSSPVSPQDGPSRSATLPDVGASTPITEETNVDDGSDIAVFKPISSSAHINGIKPPFLTRIFSFSSSSSSNPASSSSSSIEDISPTSTTSKHAFPPVSSSSSSSQISTDSTNGQIRPKARRLSTRLASFRTASSNGSKSRRTISETDSTPLSLGDGSTGIIEGEELKSPPQTPRLGSLPPSSSSFTAGSNGTCSPLRSPLARRSFFSSSPSKPFYNSTISSSPVKDLDITPQQSNLPLNRGLSNASPSTSSTTALIGNMKNSHNRPGLGKRSASDNHTTSSFKSWLMNSSSSPSTSSSSTATRDEKIRGRRISVSHTTATMTSSKVTSPVAQRRVSNVVGGEIRHARYFSDSAAAGPNVLEAVQERGRREGRRSLAVVSPPPFAPLGITKPRQNKAYRSLSYAHPPSHSIIINSTTTTSTSVKQQKSVNVNTQRGVQQKAFVNFHPFSDEDYRASSLDLSGTSALTMSLHFSDVAEVDP